jgi:NAD-dependent dihydropyrimidine dehydrogenase PreA subunit
MDSLFLRSMSKRQRIWLIAGVGLILALLLAGVMQGNRRPHPKPTAFSVDMTIQQIAPHLEVTGKALARELKLPLDVKKNVALVALGIKPEALDHVVGHLLGHTESLAKYYLFAATVLWGWLFLAKIGRPDHLPLEQKKRWFPRVGYHVPLLASVGLAGFLLGKSPNPMEGAVKVFKSAAGLYPDVGVKLLAFVFFIALAIVGNKLVCGWACPLGALQELIYSLPFFKSAKRHRLAFGVTSSIRGSLFIVMLLFLFGMVGGRKGFVVYHFINPFNLFDLHFETASIGITVLAVILISFFFYRPFCQFICPFGLISWLTERFSLYGVRIDDNTCIECGACAKACPVTAIEGRLEKKAFPADCFSCGRCLNICPVDAIKYEALWKA